MSFLLVLLLSLLALASADTAHVSLYASPGGNGTVCSAASPCSISGAVAAAAAHRPTSSTNFTVHLAEGEYAESVAVDSFATFSGRVLLTLAAPPPPSNVTLRPPAGGGACVTVAAGPGGSKSWLTLVLDGVIMRECDGAVVVGGEGADDVPALVLRSTIVLNSTATAVVVQGKRCTEAWDSQTAVRVEAGSIMTGNAGTVGGAVRSSLGAAFDGATLTFNSASSDGGAVAVTGGGDTFGGVVNFAGTRCELNTAGGNGGCLFSSRAAVSADRLTVVSGNRAHGNGGGAYISRLSLPPLGGGGSLLNGTEFSHNHAETGSGGGLYVSDLEDDHDSAKTVWVFGLRDGIVSHNSAFVSGAGVAFINTAGGLPGTRVSDNVGADSRTPPANETGLQLAFSDALFCDDASRALGSCKSCPLSKRREYILTGKDAKCKTCFDDHPVRHSFDGSHHASNWGCLLFSARDDLNASDGNNKTRRYAVCVSSVGDGLDSCPALGEDLSFDAADVVGLAALGVATLAIFNCIATTRSPEHYAAKKAERAERDGTARLLDNDEVTTRPSASDPVAAGAATEYGTIEETGTVQSI